MAAKSAVCAKCLKKIVDKHFLTCSICKKSYDLICTNSEKLFDLMDKERKTSWSCSKCRKVKSQPRKASTPIPSKKSTAIASTSKQIPKTQYEKTDERLSTAPTQIYPHPLQQQLQQQQQQFNGSVDNVTVRRYNVPIRNSFESLSDEEFDSSIIRNDTLNRSCPNLTIDYKSEVDVLQNKITNLQEKLELSDSYSTKLLLENEDLRKQIAECTRHIQNLKEICKSTTSSKVSKIGNTSKLLSRISVNKENKELSKEKSADNSIILINKGNIMLDSIDQQKIDSKKQVTTQVSKKMHILGGSQSRGLAAALLNSRRNTSYEKYQVTSSIKPGARCEDILKSLETLDTYSRNVFIINIGENDSNPIKLLAELSAFMKMHAESFIIVTGIKNSLHLNEKKLNNKVKILCKNFDNCVFLDLKDLDYFDVQFLNKLCSKINYLVDSRDYDNKYLSYNKIKPKFTQYLEDIPNKGHKPLERLRKGTIPFYFKKISLDLPTVTKKALVQKPIADYFPIRKDKQPDNKSLFRS